MSNSIVTVRGLKKKFGPNEILHGLDFLTADDRERILRKTAEKVFFG